MEAGELGVVMLVLGGFAALPAMVLAYIALTDDGATRRFHSTPRQTIRGAVAGPTVKLSGRAASETPLVGPFSGREVVWYTIVVTESERSFDGARAVEKITRHVFEHSTTPFTITDESGASARVVVDQEEIFATIPNAVTTDTGGRPLPPALQKALDARGVLTRAPNGDRKRLACIERAIAPGETVTLIGPARRVPSKSGEAAGYRRAATELVVGEHGSERRMFVMTNGPESGLASSDRAFMRWTWALGVASVLLLGIGGWLLFG